MRCRIGLLWLLCGPAVGAPLGTAFTYQGQLKESGQPASGLYDLQVCVFDGAASAIPLACAPDFNEVPVEAGLFTIALDFGASTFVGEQRYLELRVRPGASTGGYTTLAPRQPIRATPEALRSAASSAAPWSGLTGVPAGFADGIDNAGAGTVTSVSAGAGLSGGTITASGTLAVDTAVVQSRISGVCAVGQYVRQVNTDGTVLCGIDSAGGSGTVTSIATAAGLTGGPIIESGIIAIADGGVGLAQIDPTQVQARIGGTCALGSYLRGINADGSLLCTELQGATTFATLTPTGTAVLATAIAIGTDGLPVIAFYYADVGALDLGVVKCSNRNCSAGAQLSRVDDGGGSDVGSQLSIAVPPDGLPIIAYYDATNTSLKTAKCSNAACIGFGSAVIKTVDNTADSGRYPSIAIGADTLPVISYHESATGLKVVKCTDPTCSNRTIAVVDGPGIVGQFSSIAVPDDGLPVIAYQGGGSFPESRRLAIAKCLDPACSSSTRSLIESGPNAGHISIAIGHDGLPIVAHSRGLPGTLSGAWAIPVIRCATPACDAGVSTSVLSPGPNTAVSARLAIGSDGSPVIVYERVSSQILENSAIEVTRCLDTGCSAFAVPTRVDAGGISPFSVYSRAIAVASDGLPIISYLDDSARVRVAKCGTLDCR